MRGIILHDEILCLEVCDIGDLSGYFQSREGSWFPFELNFKGVNVVFVNVCVAHGVNEFTGIDVAYVCDHPCQKCIRGDIKWHTETHITGSLI